MKRKEEWLGMLLAVSATLRREVSLGVSGTELITYLVLQLERHKKVRGK